MRKFLSYFGQVTEMSQRKKTVAKYVLKNAIFYRIHSKFYVIKQMKEQSFFSIVAFSRCSTKRYFHNSHDVCFVHSGHLLPPIPSCVIECELSNSQRIFSGDNFQALHYTRNTLSILQITT